MSQMMQDPLSARSHRFRATDSLKAFVPMRNVSAIWAYYLGVAALVPVVCFLLGPFAIKYGRQGVRWAKSDPEGEGLRHSVLGIVLAITGMTGTMVAIAVVALLFTI